MDIQKQINTIRDIIVKTIPVERIYLFGSYAYGLPNADSDLDIYVTMNDDTPYRNIEAMKMVARAIHGHKSMSADIVVCKQSQFNNRLSIPTLEKEVSQRGVRIYG
jgi:predicted nucleotidyltransferase